MASLVIDSPLGPLLLTAAGGSLVALDWCPGRQPGARGEGPAGTAGGRADGADGDVLDAAAAQLAAYFGGARTTFSVPLAPRGTPFQRRVWTAMQAIPFGAVARYGDLARELGTAARAVGTACGRNPLPIIVPCHRVVGGAGPGGYSGHGGLDTKAWLLNLERSAA